MTARRVSVVFALAFSTVALAPRTAHAQQRLHAVVRGALEYGGEKVGEFTYSDGSTPDVVAGSGGLITVGGILRLATPALQAIDAQVNLGLKYRTIPPATNQDATWLRFPVEGLLFWRSPSGFGLGAGGTVHLHNVFEASGAALNDRVSFQNSPGLLVHAEYVFGDVSADLRYTALHYQIEGSRNRVDASNIGVGMSYVFGGAR